MSSLDAAPRTPPDLELEPAAPSKGRWLVALLLGAVLWLAAVFASHLIPQVGLGLRLEGWPYGLVGLIQIVLTPLVLALALRPVGLGLRELGLTTRGFGADVAIGAAVAVAFALLQFLVIIPATGGAARSDVAMNAAQLGDSLWGVAGFILLAWTGGAAEELFFRGHLLTGLRALFGPSRGGTVGAVALVTVVFALLHGYQGWAGVVDSGLYGGLTLTLLFLWRRSLTACIVAHALWNTLAVVGIYLWY